jgi:hypothetical protein
VQLGEIATVQGNDCGVMGQSRVSMGNSIVRK